MNIVHEIVGATNKMLNEGKIVEAKQFLNNLSLECLNILASFIFQNQFKSKEAIHVLKIASELDPSLWMAHSNIAHLLNSICEYEPALIAAKKAAEVSADKEPDVHYNMGVILGNLGRHEEAIEAFRRGLLINQDYHAIHYSLSLAYLRLGRWLDAWPEYEYRIPSFESVMAFRKRFMGDDWNGRVSLKNKIVLVYNEQGYGDFIHFSRYLPWLKKTHNPTVIVEMQEELAPLYENSPYIDIVIPRRSEKPWNHKLPPYDYLVSISSLPGLHGTTPTNVPNETPYLYSPNKKKLLERSGKKRIGICYSGNIWHPLDQNRSIYLRDFAPLLRDDFEVFIVQKHDAERVWPAFGPINLLAGDDVYEDNCFNDLSNDINNLGDTADFINQMDYIVTVDTVTVHLAGALNKPTYLLTPVAPDWRWGLSGGDTVWYPSVRLVRQEKPFVWRPLIERVAEEISLK